MNRGVPNADDWSNDRFCSSDVAIFEPEQWLMFDDKRPSHAPDTSTYIKTDRIQSSKIEPNDDFEKKA